MKATLFLTSLISAGIASAAECPAVGSTDAQDRYSCNPAHAYPNGQKCTTVDGCYYLLDASGEPVKNSPSSVASAQPTGTAACPAPGSTDASGRYSCNPAHQYPNGQKCTTVDGCYYLLDASGKPVNNSPSSVASAQPTGTAACLAPGSTDASGQYSCNPAHQYPNGQKCTITNGCYILCDADGHPINNGGGNNATTTAQPPPVTAGASTLQGAGVVALVAALGALL